MFDDSARRTGMPMYRRLAALSLVVVAADGALFIALGRRAERWPDPVRSETAVGDSTCISCHSDKATFERTAHRLTMRLPTRASILGNFRSGENVLRTSDPDVHVRMDGKIDARGGEQATDGLLRKVLCPHAGKNPTACIHDLCGAIIEITYEKVCHCSAEYPSSLHQLHVTGPNKTLILHDLSGGLS
jgi:hypothetical protein